MRKYIVLAFIWVSFIGSAFAAKPAQLIHASSFDTLLVGKKVQLYTLKNDKGMVVQISNYGARIVALWVPDKSGEMTDVVWGFSSIKDYLKATDVCAGPVVGRYANRIGKGQFSLNGKNYQLTLNNNGNQLHGGSNGFFTKVWSARQFKNSKGEDALELIYISPDGEEGYPGTLTAKVVYTVTGQNELKISYEATTDAATVINLTSHAYFNLHGTTQKSTNSHVLTIFADKYTPTDSLLIPTGEIASLTGTPLDFRKPTSIGQRIGANFKSLKYGKGYDHNYVLNKKMGEIALVAEVYEPANGIIMKLTTDQPGLQFYSGNFMDGVDAGKRGDRHNYRCGFALETQNFPDAPNHANFPSATLKPGETYRHVCVYGFSVKK